MDDEVQINESDWFDIFCVGTHNGEDYAMEALEQMLRNFRPGDIDAGIPGDPDVSAFIGHNDFWTMEEKPALAWVKELRIEGNYLQAKFHRIQQELIDANDSGRFCKRSVELWHNFRGRGMTLTGVAFLGSNTPACVLRDNLFVKGRDGNSFSVAVNDSGEKRGFKTLFQSQKGGELEMDKAELQSMLDKAANDAIAKFKGSDEFVTLKQRAEELETQNKQFAEEASASKKAAKRASIVAFCDGLLSEKKITPALREGGLVEFMESLDDQEKKTFGSKSCSQVDLFKELFSNILDAGKLFGEVDTDAKRDDEQPSDDEELAADVNKPIEFSMADLARK